MIRVLVMIAVAGFLVSMVTLSVAVGIGGPDIIRHGGWNWSNGHWSMGHEDHGFGLQYNHGSDRETGPQASRELAWTGGDTLTVEIPADIQYTQAPGPAKLTVTGPKGAVDDLRLKDGRLTFSGRHGGSHWGYVSVVMTAPNVSTFELDGAGKLTVAGYRQETLKLDLSGDSEVNVKGEAKTLDLQISGSADTDLGGLKVQKAQVEIDGSGQATIAPIDSAEVNISGSGDVTLLTNPSRLETNITGSGAIHHAEGGVTAPAAPAPPATPKSKV